MTSTAAPVTTRSSLTARPLRCRNCGAERAAGPVSICEQCLGPLDPVYEPGRRLPDRQTIAARAPSLWRYREWLPFDGEPVLSLDSGFTPLIETPALARRLGVARVWVKNDTVCHPSLSFKDRVVAAAINAAAAFGLDTIGCASTGNLANAVAAHAARAMRESGGWAAAVSDAALVDGIRFLAQDTGVFAETAGGVTAAAALALARAGRLGPDDEVVLCITGHGLKTLDAVSAALPEAPLIEPRVKQVAALVEEDAR